MNDIKALDTSNKKIFQPQLHYNLRFTFDNFRRVIHRGYGTLLTAS
jgi:hypothetical protein